jgi:hypothetical protein
MPHRQHFRFCIGALGRHLRNDPYMTVKTREIMKDANKSGATVRNWTSGLWVGLVGRNVPVALWLVDLSGRLSMVSFIAHRGLGVLLF